MTGIVRNNKKRFTTHRMVCGFTLVELLIVISIIAILSVVGIVVFTNVQKGARDARRKADVESIAKAYEVNYSGKYNGLTSANFASGAIPQDPAKGDYFNWLDSLGVGFKVCASLDDNPNDVCNTPAINCFCKVSSQGTIPPESSPDPSSTNTTGGLGSSTPYPLCDSGLQSGLVGYWKMDESSWINDCSTSTVLDSSGNGNNGKSCPAATGPTGGAPGKFGNGGSFDGSNDYVKLILSQPITNQTTLATWIKITADNSQWQTIVGTCPSVTYTDLRFCGTNTICFSYANHNNNPTAITKNEWHHIVGVYDGSQATLFIDGVNKGSYSELAHNFSTVAIGARTNGDFPVKGLIDDVRIYNRALSSDEISSLYNDGAGCIP